MQTRYTDHPTWIDDSAQLRQLCAQWAAEPMLALDTEFIRTDTFYPIGALVQVSDDKGCFLIDPLRIDDFSPLTALLVDPNIVKVLHSCSEDLEVFERLFGVLPEPLVDTQIAAALDGLGFSLSYQRLTEALLDIHVPKGETRSDWLQRPLTPSQIHYAALDVAYLPPMYRMLMDSLRARGRDGWLREDCDALLRASRDNAGGVNYYQRIKSAWRLNPRQLWQLQQLVNWREQTARSVDRPRGRVLKDKCCFDIVRTRPRSAHELGAIDEVGPKTVRRYGEDILAILDREPDPGDLPEALPEPLPPTTRSLAKRLKVRAQHCADQLRMPLEILARKRDIEALIRSGLDGGDYQLPPGLAGWRRTVIGEPLLAAARQPG